MQRDCKKAISKLPGWCSRPTGLWRQSTEPCLNPFRLDTALDNAAVHEQPSKWNKGFHSGPLSLDTAWDYLAVHKINIRQTTRLWSRFFRFDSGSHYSAVHKYPSRQNTRLSASPFRLDAALDYSAVHKHPSRQNTRLRAHPFMLSTALGCSAVPKHLADTTCDCSVVYTKLLSSPFTIDAALDYSHRIHWQASQQIPSFGQFFQA